MSFRSFASSRGLLKNCKFGSFTDLQKSSVKPQPLVIHNGTRLQLRDMSSSTKPRVFITRKTIPEAGIKRLQEMQYELIQRDSDVPPKKEELLKCVAGVDAIFCLLTEKIDKDVLEAAGPNLKVIGTMSVGHDHIDLAECKRRGIPVGYTPDVLTDATAELTVALLLATSRRLMEGVTAVKSGEWGTWQPLWLCGQGLQNSTVGVVGLGRIGKGVVERLAPHKLAKFLYCGKTPKPYADELNAEFVPFEELLKNSDFIVSCCALTPDTKEMFNGDTFKQMKKTAIFVNSSRGGVVNQDDLYEALRSGEIRAAGLDVTTPEPLPTDHPLLSLKNCVVLPHIGSATIDTRQGMSDLTARNIIAALEGEQMPYQIL